MNSEKLNKESHVRIGGKGTPRRKKKVVVKKHVNPSKLQIYLRKIGTSTIGNVEEVTIRGDDGSTIHFTNPKTEYTKYAGMFIVSGSAEHRKPGEDAERGEVAAAAAPRRAPEVAEVKSSCTLFPRLTPIAEVDAEDDESTDSDGGYENMVQVNAQGESFMQESYEKFLELVVGNNDMPVL